jgi:glyoxylase-like metal-dependent hydrolase (beta-lactamase superfamily II)
MSQERTQDWTQPGVYPVAPGVSRIPLPLPMDGLRAVNVYVIETDRGLVLVDGGWAIPESRRLFESAIRQLGYRLTDIRRFLVTHVHRDHYTQAYVVGQEVGAHVVLGLGDKPSMDVMHDSRHVDPNLERLALAGALELADGWRSLMPADRPSTDDYGMPDEWLDRDLVIDLGGRQLDAVSTPGHTQGHYVYGDLTAGLLFAGDHVLPTITPSIGFEPKWVQQPLRDFLDSLAKVRAMPDLKLLPAHGPVTHSTHARIDELIAHHEERLALCEQAVAAGAATAYDVAQQLPWTRRGKSLADLDLFNAALASMETFAHLELLAAQGRVDRAEGDGVVGYAPGRRIGTCGMPSSTNSGPQGS